MPARMIANPAGAYGQPLFASAGENEQLMIEVCNNTGGPLVQGMVMVWDILTALNATTALAISAAASGTIATQTLTAASSTASYPAQGLLTYSKANFATTGIGALNGYVGSMPIYYGALSGSTFTGAQLPWATATNGLLAAGLFYADPTASITPPQGVGLPAIATASDSGRYVTFSSLTSTGALAAKDPLVCGVCSPTGDAGTNGTIIPPGNNFLMAIGGVARVNVSTGTVAAGALIGTAAAIVGAADDITPTLGNTLGYTLEANTAKDTNNTIRCMIGLS